MYENMGDVKVHSVTNLQVGNLSLGPWELVHTIYFSIYTWMSYTGKVKQKVSDMKIK